MRIRHLLLCLLPVVGVLGAGFGKFGSPVQAEWLDDGREMKLLRDFVYTDQASKVWTAPKDAVVDGASIPRWLWAYIGGPYEGRYRNASVVHDAECKVKKRPWKDVHRMFYNAMRCGGVGDLKARIMFGAVYHFGPRWGPSQELNTVFRSAEDYIRMKEYIERNPNLGIDTIADLTPARLALEVPEAKKPAPETLNRQLPDEP